MAGRWRSSGVALGAAALALSCTVAARAAEKPASDRGEKNVWLAVKRRIVMASKAGDRKAAENQLGRLSAEDLFLCGQQFCDTLLSGEEERGDFLSEVYAVGLMLHLHQRKVGLEATLRAIGSAVGTTDNDLWVETSLEWIESHKRRKIPPAGMHAIAEGALRALPVDRGRNGLKAQLAVLSQVSDEDIWIHFAAKDRSRLRRHIQTVSADGKEPELRKAAANVVEHFNRREARLKRELEQCEDPKKKAQLRRRLYGPLQPQEGQPPSGGKDAR